MTELIIWILCSILIGIVIGSAVESGRSKWINAKDRRPNLWEEVLLLNQQNDMYTGFLSANGLFYPTAPSDKGTLKQKDPLLITIIKWQPLPKTK